MCFQPLFSERMEPAEIIIASADMNYALILQTGSFPYEKLKCIALGMGTLSADRVKT